MWWHGSLSYTRGEHKRNEMMWLLCWDAKNLGIGRKFMQNNKLWHWYSSFAYFIIFFFFFIWFKNLTFIFWVYILNLFFFFLFYDILLVTRGLLMLVHLFFNFYNTASWRLSLCMIHLNGCYICSSCTFLSRIQLPPYFYWKWSFTFNYLND